MFRLSCFQCSSAAQDLTQQLYMILLYPPKHMPPTCEEQQLRADVTEGKASHFVGLGTVAIHARAIPDLEYLILYPHYWQLSLRQAAWWRGSETVLGSGAGPFTWRDVLVRTKNTVVWRCRTH